MGASGGGQSLRFAGGARRCGNARALARVAFAAGAIWPGLAAGQPWGAPTDGSLPASAVRVAASERRLWLAYVGPQRTQIFHRTPTGHFDLGQFVAGRVAAMTAIDDEAVLLLMEDHSLYRFSRGRTLREVGLPERERVLDPVPAEQGLFALAAARAAAGLPSLDERAEQAGAQTPERAELSVVHYDGGAWRRVADCPPGVRSAGVSRKRPRLLAREHDLILLTALEEQGDQIAQFRYERRSGRWSQLAPLSIPGVVGFWVAPVNRAAALIVALREGEEEERAELYRDLGSADSSAPSWQRAEITLSPLAEGTAVRTYHDAFGFNQMVGLLAEDTRRQIYLQLAGIGGPPTEVSMAVREVLSRPGLHLRLQGLIQAATLLLLVVMMVIFLVFRRTTAIRPAQLSAQCELAFVSQRAAAALIDLSIFALPVALFLGVNWRDGLWKLGVWGLGGGPGSDLPDTKLLLWWAVTAGGYSLYNFVMELVVQRSVGKMLTGVHLLSDEGTPPATWQILVRNLTRLVELLPQFWILGLLIMISRNRQRLGDLFARTVAVRYVASGAERLRGGEGRDPDDRSSDDGRGDRPPGES